MATELPTWPKRTNMQGQIQQSEAPAFHLPGPSTVVCNTRIPSTQAYVHVCVPMGVHKGDAWAKKNALGTLGALRVLYPRGVVCPMG